MAPRIRCLLPVLVLPLLLILPHSATAQTRDWAALYDGGFGDWAGCPRCFTHTYLPFHRDFARSRQSVAGDAAGNIYVTGLSFNGTNVDFVTVKYDASGARLWAATYDGGEDDQPYAIAVDGSGNVYVTGDSIQAGDLGLQPRFLTVKYDTNGAQQWAVTYDGGVWSTGVTLAVDADGNAYAGGELYSGDSIAAGVIKYSPAGAQLWVRAVVFGFEYEESSFYDLVLDSAGNVYATGYSYKPFEPDVTDYMSTKLSPSGDTLWTRAYDSGGQDQAWDVAVDAAGNVFVTGNTSTVKYDAAGVEQWARPFPGTAHALITAGGFVYVAGTSGGDFQVVKYDAAGIQQWAATRDGGGADQAHTLVLAGETLYVTGHTTRVTHTDALTIGFDAASGAEVWSDLYGGAFDEYTYAAASGAGVFWIAGYANNGADDDMLVLRYSISPSPPQTSLLGLKLTPPTLVGGRIGRGRVTLSAPAPPGGAVVPLTSTNPAVTVPASVTVPEGRTSQRFEITTRTVSTVQTAVVTATLGGVSRSDTLTVRPAKAKP